MLSRLMVCVPRWVASGLSQTMVMRRTPPFAAVPTLTLTSPVGSLVVLEIPTADAVVVPEPLRLLEVGPPVVALFVIVMGKAVVRFFPTAVTVT